MEVDKNFDQEALDKLRKVLDGGYAEFVRRFSATLDGYISDLSHAVHDKNKDKIITLAHKLVSCSAVLGMKKLSLKCRELELSCGADDQQNYDTFQIVKQEYERYMPIVKASAMDSV